MEFIPDEIPDGIEMRPPVRWVSRDHRYNLSEIQKHDIAAMDNLFTTDIRSRSFLWKLLTEYPFLLDSKEKCAF